MCSQTDLICEQYGLQIYHKVDLEAYTGFFNCSTTTKFLIELYLSTTSLMQIKFKAEKRVLTDQFIGLCSARIEPGPPKVRSGNH